jgi:type II secretory pathway pseudopilin PulG
MKLPVTSCRLQVIRRTPPGGGTCNLQPSTFSLLSAFSLIEVLITVTLLALIVIALMTVFSNTQTAFRAAVTQTDVLEGARNTMEMIAEDLRVMVPSDKPPFGNPNNVSGGNVYAPVNFFSLANNYAYAPLVQNLPASTAHRTNLLNYFFVLGYDGQRKQWTGNGYIVDTASTEALYPLYRFHAETNDTVSPLTLFKVFSSAIFSRQWTNMSHVIDGVTHLVVRAQDPRGNWINNNVLAYTNVVNANDIYFFTPAYGEAQLYMFSNTVPAAVELQMGIIEDRTLQRAEALPAGSARINYLSQQAGHVHVFRQLVSIPNVDPSAYQ